MIKPILTNIKNSPTTSSLGAIGLGTLVADLDKVQTPKDWVLFGIKTALFLFMGVSQDPWKHIATTDTESGVAQKE